MSSIAVSWSTPHRTLTVMACMSGMTVMTMIPMSALPLMARRVYLPPRSREVSKKSLEKSQTFEPLLLEKSQRSLRGF